MGAEHSEQFGVILSVAASALIHHWVTTRYSYYHSGSKYTLFVVEFIALSLIPLLIHTYLGEHVVLSTFVLLIFCALLCKSTRRLRSLRTSIFREFKVTILVSTCLVISAIDCRKIFKHEFGKTSSYGYSPMDLGTGFFVAVRGLDSLRRDLRRINAFERPISNREYTNISKKPVVEPQYKGFEYHRFLVLFMAGLLRLAFIELSGYGHDIKEYGVHWNFFMTLAFIEFFISLFHFIFRYDLAVPIVSVVVGILYFMVLSFTDFEKYLLGFDTKRTNLFDANREGICSTFGYLFIFGLTYLTSRFCLPPLMWDDRCTRHAEYPKLLYMVTRNLVVTVLVYLASLKLFGLPSRRAANFVYGLHVHTGVTLIIFLTHIYMHRCGKRLSNASLESHPYTLHTAISRNGFFFFLTANFLTAALNYVRKYIDTGEKEFMSMILYMFVLCLSTQLLDVYYYKANRNHNVKDRYILPK